MLGGRFSREACELGGDAHLAGFRFAVLSEASPRGGRLRPVLVFRTSVLQSRSDITARYSNTSQCEHFILVPQELRRAADLRQDRR
jgi:hypothetical protein